MTRILAGNAQIDSQPTRHWLVGHFISPDNIRHSKDVEIKWGVHKQGENREEWVTGEKRTSTAILVSGKVIIEFREKNCELSAQGDYVMWGIGVDHRWRVVEDSVVITVRWPSMAARGGSLEL